MKNSSVVHRDTVLGGAADGILPVLRSGGQADEVGDADWGLVGKQGAGHLADTCVNDGGGLRRNVRRGGFGRRGLFRAGLGRCERGDCEKENRKTSAHECSFKVEDATLHCTTVRFAFAARSGPSGLFGQSSFVRCVIPTHRALTSGARDLPIAHLKGRCYRDPSLRLKSGSAQDDTLFYFGD